MSEGEGGVSLAQGAMKGVCVRLLNRVHYIHIEGLKSNSEYILIIADPSPCQCFTRMLTRVKATPEASISQLYYLLLTP